MTQAKTFTARLRDDGAFEVPFDVRAVYGSARAPVKMTLLGETYRTRVMVYGGRYVLGIWKAVLAKHNLSGGARLEVTLAPDTDERVVDAPPELAAALKKNAAARAGWTAMSYTHQREWAAAITDAKKPETRARRVAQAVEACAARAAKAAGAKAAKVKATAKVKVKAAKAAKPAKATSGKPAARKAAGRARTRRGARARS
jgi:hypothetical protein